MRVIGTAGHVDHGKSTLVEALTGVHPDRLKEEREREMTIDLGFAWFTLPSGEEVGIIDVPGHRDFIENMLAGVGGIDAVLFVVAADEGVMPQTREHLSILDILQIKGGVVALTKIDVLDPDTRSEWLELVEADLRTLLSGTILAEAPVLRVSARTGEGLESLRQALDTCLAGRPPRPDLGRPRLPVDRVFTMAGFGTIVTGTLIDGRLNIGDEVQVLPAGLEGRVRGLQTHKKKEQTAIPGSRTAVNISGINLNEVRRGDTIVHPGDYQITRRLDAHFHLLPDVSQEIRHNIEVKLFIGTTETMARLRLLGCETLQPGQEGWLQLEPEQPVVAVRGDRYILRRPSPGETLGGGVIIDPHPDGRHKRYSEKVLTRLKTLAKGSPEELVLQTVFALTVAPWSEVIARSNLEESIARQALEDLLASGQVLLLENPIAETQPSLSPVSISRDSLITSRGTWEQLTTRLIHEVEEYHRSYPLRRGMPREELKSRLKLNAPPLSRDTTGSKGISAERFDLSGRLFNAVIRSLVANGSLQENGPLILRAGYTIQFNQQQESQIARLFKQFTAAPHSPPSVKECIAEIGEDLFNALVELGELVPMSSAGLTPEIVFRRVDFESMVAETRRLIQTHGAVSAAQVRDYFNTSRRYALAFLEHLDALGITVREGDFRRLKT